MAYEYEDFSDDAAYTFDDDYDYQDTFKDTVFDNRQTFQQFKDSYVEATKKEYYQFLLITPTFESVRIRNSHWLHEEPMTEKEFQQFKEAVDEKTALGIHKLRSMTFTGFYIEAWYRWVKNLFTYSFEEFKEAQYDNAYNEWSYNQDY